MIRTRVLLAAATLFALALPAEAQWNVERRSGSVIAMAAGIDGQIHVGVSCQGSNQVVALTLPDSATFHNGDVEVQWDDGSTEQHALQDLNDTLSGSSASPPMKALIEKLQQRNTVRLRVTKEQGEQVTDRISLSGSSRAIGSLPCSSSTRALSSQRTDAQIRQVLISQSISRYSGSCPCPYNTDRGGRRCGGRSAYSRPGGASPLYYPGDVSDGAVEAYRARTER